MGTSRGSGGPFGERRKRHSETESRNDGKQQSVQHHVDVVTETDAPRSTGPQQHSASCDRAQPDPASARKISSWLGSTHRARALAATSCSGARREPLQDLAGFADRDSEGSAAAATGAAETHAGVAGMRTHLRCSCRHRAVGAICRSRSCGIGLSHPRAGPRTETFPTSEATTA